MKSLIYKSFSSPFFIYTLKVLIGFGIGYNCFLAFPQYELFWALLSIILVISPEEIDTKKLTIERVKSNFIGSMSGLMVFFFPFDDSLKLIIGIFIALFICKYFDLMKVARSAVVALLIVLIEHKSESYHAPISRFIAVASGCLTGLCVSLLVGVTRDFILKIYKKSI